MLSKFQGKIFGGEIDRCFQKKDIKSGTGTKKKLAKISLTCHLNCFSNFQ